MRDTRVQLESQEVTHVPGNLFVKTHTKSTNLWAPISQSGEGNGPIGFSVNLSDLSKPVKTINVAKYSGLRVPKATRRAVHLEYNADGTEVWISLWGGKMDQSAIVVFDDRLWRKVIADRRMITSTRSMTVIDW